jgi:hypothetical protein
VDEKPMEKRWKYLWKRWYPPVNIEKANLKMAIEIVSLPIKHGDFPLLCKRLPEGVEHV